jgi:TusE/DsrC/DsvC family sulfur relay protein
MAHALRDIDVLFDEDGFIVDPARWNDTVAEKVAEADGLGTLTNEQWEVIHAVHGHYLRVGALPPLHQVCRSAHMDRRHLEELFGKAREAYRLSGIPNPGEEAKAYM